MLLLFDDDGATPRGLRFTDVLLRRGRATDVVLRRGRLDPERVLVRRTGRLLLALLLTLIPL